MPISIAIIGSGFLGLTLALRLSQAGRKVTIFESASEIGGLASAWQIGDVVWDKHYHVTLLSDSYTRRIVSEIGLADDFNWVETKTGFYADGKLHSMSDTIEFLRFPPLGILHKLRLGATIFYASRVKSWRRLERIPVERWLKRLSGRNTFEKIWRPLLKAKLGQAYKETSAAFIWATIQRMYAARNSGMKKELFGYVRGGYARVLGRFEEVLKERGIEVRLNSRVTSVEKLPSGKIVIAVPRPSSRSSVVDRVLPESDETPVHLDKCDREYPLNMGMPEDELDLEQSEFDQAILTCPSDIASKLVQQLTIKEKSGLSNVKYQGIICASVLMRRSLSPFYVTNIIEETPFTGIIEMSALVDKQEFNGNALVYLPKYVASEDELFDRTDKEIKDVFLDYLERMYPDFSKDDVLTFKISRVRRVFPIPVVNYSSSLPEMRTSLSGIFIVNSAHILNGTLNVNETVQLAERFFENYMSDNGGVY